MHVRPSSNTMTTTLTLTETPPPSASPPPLVPLVLHLRFPSTQQSQQHEQPRPVEEKLSPEDRLKVLLAEMKRTSQSAQQAQMVSEWTARYFNDYAPALSSSSPLPAQRIRAARALCFLLSNTPEPLPQECIAKLKAIIAEILKISPNVPKNHNASVASVAPADVDAFICDYQQKEARALIKKLEKDLYARANRVNEALAAQFEQLKAELLALNAEREMQNAKLYERLDAVNQKIKQLVLDMQKVHQGMEQVEQGMQAQEQELSRVLPQCEGALKKAQV